MNALFGFLSSPLKKAPERPPPSTMPLSASQSRTQSPRERRLSKRASDRFSEPEGRSPRSRRSNVSSTTFVHDTSGDISIVSSRRETIATMPPPSKTPKRTSMGATQSSPAVGRLTASTQRVASSPRVRSSPRRMATSPELGEDSVVASGFNSVNGSPAISVAQTRSAKNSPAMSATRSSARNTPAMSATRSKDSPAMSAASNRSGAKSTPATSSGRRRAVMKPNFTAVNSPLVSKRDRSSARPSPRTQGRASQVQVAQEEEEEIEAQEAEEPEPEEQEPEEPEPEQELEQEPEEQEAEDDEEHEFKRIMDYRWVDDRIELRVEWSDGERTWTDEEIFQEDAPEALFDFWRTFPNGRPDNPNDPGVYQVFAIRKHRTHRGKKQVLVEWLGYDSSECTWENQNYIEQVAPDHVDDYMSKVKGTGKANQKTKAAPKTTKKGTAKSVAKSNGKPKAETKSSTRTIAAPLGKTRGKSRVTKR